MRNLLAVILTLIFTNYLYANEGQYLGGKVKFKNTPSETYKGYQEFLLEADKSITEDQLVKIRTLHVGLTCQDKKFAAFIEESDVKNHRSKQVVKCKTNDKKAKGEKDAAIYNLKKDLTSYCSLNQEETATWAQDPLINELCIQYLAIKN